MSLVAFDGAAGSGKTYSVIEELRARLAERPLLSHERVLAVTFMHGARHRLDEQLEKIEGLRGRYDAITLDSLAWRVCRRWSSRLRELAIPVPGEEDFDANCRIAGQLLAMEDVRNWVSVAYPFILVDEAQDLESARLSLIDALMRSCAVFLAFDEFQSLNSANRPVAVTTWIADKCTPVTLAGNRRTQVTDLIAAAQQIRGGHPLTANGRSFRVVVAPSRQSNPAYPATLIGLEIRKGGSFALLTPARDSPYAQGIVELLSTQSIGKNKIGPFPIQWEGGMEAKGLELARAIRAAPTYSLQSASTLFESHPDVLAGNLTVASLRRIRGAKGVSEFSTDLVQEIFNRHLSTTKQFTRRRDGGCRAMTIHQAKNREFDRVAVVWPFQLPPGADDRRRLLYNAITRAKASCIVVIQADKLRTQAPFT